MYYDGDGIIFSLSLLPHSQLAVTQDQAVDDGPILLGEAASSLSREHASCYSQIGKFLASGPCRA